MALPYKNVSVLWLEDRWLISARKDLVSSKDYSDSESLAHRWAKHNFICMVLRALGLVLGLGKFTTLEITGDAKSSDVTRQLRLISSNNV